MDRAPFPRSTRARIAGVVFAVFLVGLQAGVARAANITSAATGNWSAAATWSPAQVPTAADNVTIANGNTVTIDAAASCLSLTVGQGVSGILQFQSTTARTLTVGGDVTIATGGIFQSATSGTVTTHVLTLAGSLTNNGTLDFSTNANTAGVGITFTGATSNTFSGTGGTTDILTLAINKGTSSANVLELMPNNFTVKGVSTDVAGFLTLTNGTFKLSGSFAMTNRTFPATSYTIPATGGLWLNNPNYTVPGQNGTATNNGLLRITQGTLTAGTVAGSSVAAGAGATFTIEGGTLNIASRFATSSAITFTQSGGTVNVTTASNATSNVAGLDLSSASNTVTLSGGTIALVQANSTSSNQNKRDYNMNANPATVSITGGTLKAGTAATTGGFLFSVAGFMSNLVVDNTTTTKSVQLFTGSVASQALSGTINTGSTLDLNTRQLTITGSTFTNNGTLAGTGAGSTLVFQSETLAQTYAGSGATSSPLDGITVDSPSGLTLGNTASIVTLNARLLRGLVTNSSKLTLGTGVSAAVQTLIGKSGLLTAGGSFDVAPTFNLGAGAYSVSYQPEGGGRTTGFEIPSGSRSVTNLTVNNANGVTLSGGNLTVTGTLTLSSGNVTTGASTLVMGSAGTVSRTSGHIVGNLGKNVATGTSVSRTFEIGTGTSYAPATVLFTSVSTAGNLTASTTAGDHPNLGTSGITPTLSVNRYWTLTNGGVAFTDYGITLNFVAGDVDAGANPSTFLVRKYTAPNWSALMVGARTSTSTQATGITSFGDFAVGQVTHSITASAGANGSISPGGVVVVDDGASRTFTLAPAACYRIADVLVDGVSVGALTSYTFTNVTADHTISVSFANDFPITASSGAHGSITPAGTTYVSCGASQTFTITPDVDYVVGNVLLDGVSVGAVTSYTFTNVSGPHTIAASFVLQNNPPVLTNVPASATIPELGAYTFTATATDVESPPEVLTFSLVGAPTGASIDPTSGVFTWTPTEAQGPGVYPFSVRVYDGKWNTDAPITLTVSEVNLAPAISGVPSSATIPEMVATTFTASATDGDVPVQALTFSLVGAPAGASIDASTGAFSWTPAEAQGPGTYPFAVRVSDGLATTDAPITLEVTEVNRPPVLSGVPAAVSVPELVPYTFTAAGSDPDVPAQTLAFSLVGAPSGAAIDPGTGVFTWTPGVDQTGANAFVVRVTDGVATSDVTVTITVTIPGLAGLTAAQVKSGNDGSGRTRIQLTWSPVPSPQTVEVYRAGFGGYPRYDDAGGQVPSTPSYPPGAPWVLTGVTATGTTDQPPVRDFYYYVAFVHGPNGAVSPASNKTPGTLDYHLGDVSDGVTVGQGDNAVSTTDLSLLGAHYGLEGPEALLYDYLDVGPTADYSTDALPLTDGFIDFEDLIVLAINVDAVSRPAGAPALAHEPAAWRDALTLGAVGAVALGDTIQLPLRLSTAGAVQGLSLQLAWDAARVRPLGVEPGDMMASSRGIVLSPRPGAVDAAFLGAGGARGEGVLATLSFLALAAGDPGIRVARLIARDPRNQKVALPIVWTAPPRVVPTVTTLAAAAPNPFQRRTALSFDLAQAGHVELALYSVDGRCVRTLVDGVREAGQYPIEWDGRDARGNAVAPGVYYVRFRSGSRSFTRPIVLLP
jgi:hypothetical protein